MSPTPEVWMIKHPNGTYYECMTNIGPKFGAERHDAQTFSSQFDAHMEMTKHTFAFTSCKVESSKI